MRAAYTGRQKVAQFLLENGAKTDLKDAVCQSSITIITNGSIYYVVFVFCATGRLDSFACC